MGTVYVLLSVASSTTVFHAFRAGQRIDGGRATIPVVVMLWVNYIFASLSGWLQTAGTEVVVPDSPWFWVLGLWTGVLFIGNFWLLNKNIAEVGAGPASALSRLSAVLPVAATALFFGETLGMGGGIALILAAPALVLSPPERITGRQLKNLRSHLGWALLLFFGFGVNDFMLKLRHEFFGAGSESLFLSVVYSTALVIASLVMARLGVKGQKIQWKRGLALGAILGVANYGSTYFFVRALQHIPSVAAYPINSLSIIVAVTLTSTLFWKERPKPHQYIMLVLSAGAIGLLSV